MSEAVEALVVGAGPAGLMAAEILSQAGVRVVVAEAMPSPGRKLLMAGKSGLNLTRDQPQPAFWDHVAGDLGYLGDPGARFGPQAVRAWAEGLGVPLFTGTTGRVFPVGMKASPLLRAWLARLGAAGVEIRTRWRWTGVTAEGCTFQTPEGDRLVRAGVVVLALGGASWPRLGSDGAWATALAAVGVPLAPFRPANMGLRVRWSSAMARHMGAAVKGVALRAGDGVSRGEWVITRAGLEGGGIYAVSAALRDGAAGMVDLAPDLAAEALVGRMARPRGRLSLGTWLRRVLGDPVRVALLLEWGRPWPATPEDWAARAKALPLRHDGVAGLDRAISAAGGIVRQAFGPDLQLAARPGVFVAGEMLDWEAPTGGYLLTACLASGRHAGQGALRALRGAPA